MLLVQWEEVCRNLEVALGDPIGAAPAWIHLSALLRGVIYGDTPKISAMRMLKAGEKRVIHWFSALEVFPRVALATRSVCVSGLSCSAAFSSSWTFTFSPKPNVQQQNNDSGKPMSLMPNPETHSGCRHSFWLALSLITSPDRQDGAEAWFLWGNPSRQSPCSEQVRPKPAPINGHLESSVIK